MILSQDVFLWEETTGKEHVCHGYHPGTLDGANQSRIPPGKIFGFGVGEVMEHTLGQS